MRESKQARDLINKNLEKAFLAELAKEKAEAELYALRCQFGEVCTERDFLRGIVAAMVNHSQ